MPPSNTQPTSTLNRMQTLGALRLWTVEGCIATVQGTLTSGAFQTGFALYLGSTSVAIGLIAGIGPLLSLLQPFSTDIAERFGSRKYISIWSSAISRLLWLLMLAIPFALPNHHELWVPLFLGLTFLSSILGNVSSPLWTSWISDLVPADIRGRYFGNRNMYMGVIGIVVSIAAGAFLDHAIHQGHWPQKIAFATLFFTSCFFALGSLLLGSRSPDVSRPRPDREARKRAPFAFYSAPFLDVRFRALIAFFIVVTFAQGIGGPFFVVYPLVYLHLGYSMFQVLNAFSGLASLAAMPLWGFLSDKYGNKPVLAISLVLVVLPPVMWCFAYPEATAGFLSVAPSGDLLLSFPKFDIIALNIFAGVGWAGLGLAQLNLMIGLSPRETRSSYLAAISASVGVAGGLSPLIGGALMHSFAHLHYPVHGLIKNNYHVVFMISAFLRLFAFYPLGKLYEERSRTTRYVLGQLRASPPIASITALHRLSKPADSTSRMQAAKDLGKMRAPVAVEDLVKALDDVSLTVREQAATSLGEIGDDRAVGPLMDKLTDPASGITMEAATALGNIGHRAALPALAAAMEIEGPQARKTAAMAALGKLRDARVPHILVRFVGDPDPGMRASAVRALSIRDEHVASPDVKAAIMAQWKIEDDPTIQALLIEAIARTGGADLVPGLIDDIPRITSPAIKREILNAIGSLVAGPESFYVYLMLDQFARDEAVSKILGALCRKFRALGVAGAARLTARMRQAQRCFTSGDYTVCVNRLAHAAELLASGMAGQEIAECQALNVAVRLAASFAEADADEALLLVFLLKTAVG